MTFWLRYRSLKFTITIIISREADILFGLKI